MKKLKKYSLLPAIILSYFTLIYISYATFVGAKAETGTVQKADAILILGARSYIDGKYNPCLKARVEHAITLYKNEFAPKIIVSGGDDVEDNVNEAETMRKIAVENRVEVKDILLEKNATSTYENFALSKEILKKNQLNSVIIVTEPFHMARAELVARKLQYDYSVSPAKDSPCWVPNKYFSKYFLKEPIALIMYRLQNKL